MRESCALVPVVSSSLDAPAAALLLGSVVLSVVTMHPAPEDSAAAPRSPAAAPRSPAYTSPSGRPRRSVATPKRLGDDDGFCGGAAGKWSTPPAKTRRGKSMYS